MTDETRCSEKYECVYMLNREDFSSQVTLYYSTTYNVFIFRYAL